MFFNINETSIITEDNHISEEILIDAANKCIHFAKWARMDDSIYCDVHELKSVSVDINTNEFCFAKYTGSEESLNTILKDYSRNNHFRYGAYEVYPKENNYGIWLCGKVTQLNGLKESCIINESLKNAVNDKGEKVPEVCPKCGEKIGVFIQGEPVYLCTGCKKYFGTVPFHSKRKKKKSIKESALEVFDFDLL